LPQAGGAAHRIGEGLIGALHHRQQREFGGHAAPLDLGDDVVHVPLAALEHPLQVFGVVFEPRELLVDGGSCTSSNAKPARIRSNKSS